MEYDLLKVKPMKKILVICLACLSLAAQAQTFVWPMAGKKAGEDILAQPQGFIGDELSYGELFIGGKAGDVVICPVDGTIISLESIIKSSLMPSFVKVLILHLRWTKT